MNKISETNVWFEQEDVGKFVLQKYNDDIVLLFVLDSTFSSAKIKLLIL